MDVHRSRFVPYPTSAVNALAFSHANDDEIDHSYSHLKLAIGRANGDIEIWNAAKGAWVQERIFRGGRNRSVEGLQWTQEPDDTNSEGNVRKGRLRLFSIGYSSTVTEWDLSSGLPLRQSTGNHSEAWCLAAQPRITQKQIRQQDDAKPSELGWQGQSLIVGCADGTLAVLSTQDNDLQFSRFVARSSHRKARCLSVTFQNRHVIVAGFADSNIRIYDMRSSTVLRNVSFGAAPAGGPREILVWKVRCLPNGDIVSGDSTGEIRFFDGKIYSQYQRLRGHDADVLDLAVSQDGRHVWSTGMDRRTAMYTYAKEQSKWAKAEQKTYHEHDVKAMATFEGRKLSLIAAGGLDTNAVIFPMRGYWTNYHRTLSGMPHVSPTASLPSRRLMLSWWNTELSVWRIAKGKHSRERPYKLEARIGLKGEENITSATIATLTRSTALIVAATTGGVKFFTLHTQSEGLGDRPVKRLQVSCGNEGAQQVRVSPDSRWLAIVTTSNNLRLFRLSYNNASGLLDIIAIPKSMPRLRRKPNDSKSTDMLGPYTRSISRMTFSQDSRMLAVSDLSGYIDAWLLEGDEDLDAERLRSSEDSTSESDSDSDSDLETSTEERSNSSANIYGQHWITLPNLRLLPKLHDSPLILTFRPMNPSSANNETRSASHHSETHEWTRTQPSPLNNPDLKYHLVILTASHQLFEFDMLSGQLSSWSKRNPTKYLPAKFRIIVDRAQGSLWDDNADQDSQRLWIWGVNWLCMFDMARDLVRADAGDEEKGSGGMLPKKRKRNDVIAPAGGRKRPEDLLGLVVMPRDMQKSSTKSPKGKQPNGVHTNGINHESEDEEMAIDEASDAEVEVDVGMGNDDDTSAVGQVNGGHDPNQRFFCTFQYRPILGIVSLGGEEGGGKLSENGEGGTRIGNLEVMIVERPIWDLELPARFEPSYKH